MLYACGCQQDFNTFGLNCLGNKIVFEVESRMYGEENPLLQGRRLWETQFPGEPFEVQPDTADQEVQYARKSSYDIISGMSRQRSFLYQVQARMVHEASLPPCLREGSLQASCLHSVASHVVFCSSILAPEW